MSHCVSHNIYFLFVLFRVERNPCHRHTHNASTYVSPCPRTCPLISILLLSTAKGHPLRHSCGGRRMALIFSCTSLHEVPGHSHAPFFSLWVSALTVLPTCGFPRQKDVLPQASDFDKDNQNTISRSSCLGLVARILGPTTTTEPEGF